MTFPSLTVTLTVKLWVALLTVKEIFVWLTTLTLTVTLVVLKTTSLAFTVMFEGALKTVNELLSLDAL